jgi:hypothetical protein
MQLPLHCPACDLCRLASWQRAGMLVRKILSVLPFMCSLLAQVVVAPLVRLTNKAAAKIEDIGPPEGILTSLGAFITGAHV